MPDNATRAVREALRRRQAALSAGRAHLVETTLADSGILPAHGCRAKGRLPDCPELRVCRFARLPDQYERIAKLTYEYGKPLIGVALGRQRLFSGVDAEWDARWKPSEPEATATLWRYMSFAKFYSLLERRELFFSLVGDMEDKYEGFISPPLRRDQGDRLHQAEHTTKKILHKIARAALVSCWTSSDNESALMWKAYAGGEGVAIRTTFRDLQESIRSIAELPVTFGQVEYVDYRQQEVPRFGWAPLFHKRVEYRSEGEVRALLPGPPMRDGYSTYEEMMDIRLDPDVEEQRGRYISVDLSILMKEVVVPPHVPSWFTKVVKSAVQRSSVEVDVRNSSIDEELDAPRVDDPRPMGLSM